MITTPGRLLLRSIVPEDIDIPEELDAKNFTKLVEDIAKKHPEEYPDIVDKLNDLGAEIATEYGREASLRLSDFKPTPKIQSVLNDYRTQVYKITQSRDLTSEEKERAISELADSINTLLQDKLYKDALAAGNRLALQVYTGARGGKRAKSTFAQIIAGDLINYDSAGNPIPVLRQKSLSEGLSTAGYFASAPMVRKSLADVQLATAKTGYLSRQLAGVAHRQVVTMDDCKTQNGIIREGSDPGNIGAILLRDTGKYKAGTVITQDMLSDLDGMKILVRSPITCDAAEGVCAKCVGIRERGTFPSIGENVGLNAVKAFTEPLVQVSISSKHGGSKLEKHDDDLVGFERINQFVQVPEEFELKAAVADSDGVITDIKPAPQGGTYIYLNNKPIHIQQGFKPVVSVGDKVEAGDVLSEGIPNPEEIVKYKGLGAGRIYFLDKFSEILEKNNVKTDRRNLELFTRPMIGRVVVKDSDTFPGYLEGDIVDYDSLKAVWQPREDAQLKTLTTAANLYLEKPYLHYTIGTKVTKKVIDDLKQAGLKEVLVHNNPPPFEPVVIRAQDYLAYDPDWLTRMAGEKLERRMLETLERGGKSSFESTSYFPSLIGLGHQTSAERPYMPTNTKY